MTGDHSVEDTWDSALLNPRRPEAAGIITVWDGARPVHHVAITDGLEATLRSGNSALTSSASTNGIPGEVRFHGDVTITNTGYEPLVMRVGELVALAYMNVLLARPPGLFNGYAYDGLTRDRLGRLERFGGIRIAAAPEAGRRALARSIHYARFGNNDLVEVDGRTAVDEASAAKVFERIRAVGPHGSVYISHLDRVCPWFIGALHTIVAHTSIIVSLDDMAPAMATDRRFRWMWRRFEVEPLCERVPVVPLLVTETLRRLGSERRASAKFIEAMLIAVLRDELEVLDVVRVTREAERRARADGVRLLLARHLASSSAPSAGENCSCTPRTRMQRWCA